MSKFLVSVLAVVGVVSGQGYSAAGSTSAAATTTSAAAASSIISAAAASSTVSVVATPASSSSTGSVSPDISITDTSSLPYTTEIFYYCTTPTYSAAGPFITIFNTFFIDVCSTGITQIAYTITDTCGCQHETDYVRPTGCPSGFTTTEKICTACPGSPVITCTTPIGQAIETSNTITGAAGSPTGSPAGSPGGSSGGSSEGSPVNNAAGSPAGSTFGSNPEYPSQSYAQQPGSTPSSAPGTHPTYETTNSAKPAAGSSPLGILMMTSMVAVAGLLYVL